MITEWVMSLCVWLFMWVVNLVPTPGLPDGWDDSGSVFSSLNAAMAGVDNWLPVPLLVSALLVVSVAWLAGMSVRVFRIIVSHFTGGGGSAA